MMTETKVSDSVVPNWLVLSPHLSVQGKGTITTYWLTGENPPEYQPPANHNIL